MSTKKRLLIYAPTIRSYGGIALLKSFESENNDYVCEYVINKSLKSQSKFVNCQYVSGKFSDLWKFERRLCNSHMQYDLVVSLANRPLLFRVSTTVVTLIMSTLIVESVDLSVANPERQIKSRLQLFLNKILKNNTSYFYTRSKDTSRKLEQKLGRPVKTFAFMPEKTVYRRCVSAKTDTQWPLKLFYPADLQKHKNHKILLEAIELSQGEGSSVELILTVSEEELEENFPEFLHLNIKAVGYISKAEITENYNSCDAVIYPSLTESMALVLVEARQCNCAVIASELDYVREVIDPEESFDPMSAISISRAIRRFECNGNDPIEIKNSSDFLNHLCRHV